MLVVHEPHRHQHPISNIHSLPAMTDAPLSPNPLGDAAATEDQVGLATAAIGAGLATSIALLSLVTWWTFRLALASGIDSVTALSPDAAHVNMITYGIVATLVTSGGVAWWLMMPIRSTYRRFGLSMVAVLGGFVLGAVITTIVRETLGTALLPGSAAVAALLAVLGVRRARRLARSPAP